MSNPYHENYVYIMIMVSYHIKWFLHCLSYTIFSLFIYVLWGRSRDLFGVHLIQFSLSVNIWSSL